MTVNAPHAAAGSMDCIAGAAEIEISTRRRDGTLRAFVPIWVVAVAGASYVRSYRGPDGAWFRHAAAAADAGGLPGAIRIGGRQVEASFARVERRADDLHEAIDVAYREKYARYGDSFLQPMLGEQAIASTLRLTASCHHPAFS